MSEKEETVTKQEEKGERHDLRERGRRKGTDRHDLRERRERIGTDRHERERGERKGIES